MGLCISLLKDIDNSPNFYSKSIKHTIPSKALKILEGTYSAVIYQLLNDTVVKTWSAISTQRKNLFTQCTISAERKIAVLEQLRNILSYSFLDCQAQIKVNLCQIEIYKSCTMGD